MTAVPKLGAVLMMAISLMLARCTGTASSRPTTTRTTAAIRATVQPQVRVTPTAVTGAAGYLWMLGTYPCSTGTCPVLMRSTDGGKFFVRVGTPPSSVDAIDFANRDDGYAYFGGSYDERATLYWTGNGGRTWRLVPLRFPESRSPSIVIASGRAYMLVAEACLSNGECKSQVLASSPVTSDSWTTTALHLPVEEAIQPVGLAAFRSKVWVIGTGASAVLSVSSNGGRSFANLSSTGLAGLACDATATSASVLWAFCATGSLGYAARSTDGGREFALMPGWNHGYKGDASNAGSIIPLSDNEAVFRSGGPYFYLTRDGGREFSSVWSHNDWNHLYSIAFADTTSWVMLGVSEGPGGNHPLWRTTNSGRTWQPVKAPTVGAAASIASCKASQLTVGGFGTSGAAGHGVVTIRVGNTSAVVCSLRGYPVVTFLNYAGTALHVTVSHVGIWPPGVATVVLPPGRPASAGFIIISGDTSATPCPMASSIRVKLPSMATSFMADTAILILGINLCGSRSPVDISPIVKGALLAVSPPVLPEAEFPTTFYPEPEKFPGVGGYPSGCPDLAGVTISTQPSREVLAKLLDRLGGTIDDALLASDPSYWPIIFVNWPRFHSVSSAQLVISRLIGSGYVELAQRCGKATVSHLWLGQVCSGRSPFVVKGRCRSPALATEVLFLNRSGRWLVVYTYP